MLTMHRRTLLFGVAVLGACGGSDVATTAPAAPSDTLRDSPSRVDATTDTLIVGVVGVVLVLAPTVSVHARSGAALAGVNVTFTMTSPGPLGSDPSITVATIADGSARIIWSLGTTPGERTLTAVVAGLPPVVFRVTLVAASAPAAPAVVSVRGLLLRDAGGEPLPSSGGVRTARVAIDEGALVAGIARGEPFPQPRRRRMRRDEDLARQVLEHGEAMLEVGDRRGVHRALREEKAVG
jgi:hypothetical protein